MSLFQSITFWSFFSIFLILLDQISKIYFRSALQYTHSVKIFSFLDIVLAYNYGAAFGFLSKQGNWAEFSLIIFGIFSISLIIKLFFSLNKKTFTNIALSMILSGGIGNLTDRVIYGKVTDFILIHVKNFYFPIFNFADIFISLGALLLIIDEIFYPEKIKKFNK
ncbi:MAG: signal peptidase II [Bordetella sp.]|nr:MAG: signal peptidase II [Bordetella sp.]